VGVPHGENAVQISGILNTAAGAGFILDGTLALARRGPLEAMVRDPEFARVTMSSEGEDWLDRRLAAAARRGRIERQVAGSLSLVAGLTIVGLGVANLIQQDENQPARAVLGATEVAAGLGFSAAGVRSLVVPSDAEHALVAWKGRGNTSVVSVRIGPTLGGIRVSGKF
jgi:hypothetical protein